MYIFFILYLNILIKHDITAMCFLILSYFDYRKLTEAEIETHLIAIAEKD